MKSVCTACHRFESQQVALRQRHTTVIDSSHTWMHQGTWAKLRNELVGNGKWERRRSNNAEKGKEKLEKDCESEEERRKRSRKKGRPRKKIC
ncbi:hypothetical protein QVD17_32001 [Tagetes erecta]|uniref:Uncharacterized protein n=1 Tax=Tagetes erecta TaxID=13708 RepID=A0AAD8K4U0_TARER|nr:hypothetical protein QVD17_32001 [Tagetes erecta]